VALNNHCHQNPNVILYEIYFLYQKNFITK